MIKQQQEGFKRQLLFRFAPEKIEMFKKKSLFCLLFATDIGYYPHASKHFVDRPNGAPNHILIHCVGGKGWFEINGTRYRVNDGEFFIIPKNMPHQYGSDEGWRIYWLHIDGMKALEFMRQIGKGDASPKCEPNRLQTIGIFRDILDRLSSGPSIAVLNYLHFSLWHLLGMYLLHKALSENEIYGSQRINKAISFMNKHIYEHLTLNAMAHYVGLSVSRFSQLFRIHTGYSPVDYYIRLKVQRAEQLLSSTNMQIQEISWKCGWNNQFYFSRIFKQVTGHAPQTYRNLYKI